MSSTDAMISDNDDDAANSSNNASPVVSPRRVAGAAATPLGPAKDCLPRSFAQRLFEAVDLQDDDRLTSDELARGLTIIENEEVAPEDVRRIFSMLDTSGTGSVTFEEFYQGLALLQPPQRGPCGGPLSPEQPAPKRITFVDELEEKAELETQVIASEDFNDDNDVVMAALREEILELQSKVAVKQSSLNATKERCAQLLRQMRAVEDENDQLKEQEASWRRRLEVSAQKVSSLRSQAEASEVFAAEHKGKHEALQKQLDSLEEERSSLERECAASRRRLELKEEQLESLQAEVHNLKEPRAARQRLELARRARMARLSAMQLRRVRQMCQQLEEAQQLRAHCDQLEEAVEELSEQVDRQGAVIEDLQSSALDTDMAALGTSARWSQRDMLGSVSSLSPSPTCSSPDDQDTFASGATASGQPTDETDSSVLPSLLTFQDLGPAQTEQSNQQGQASHSLAKRFTAVEVARGTPHSVTLPKRRRRRALSTPPPQSRVVHSWHSLPTSLDQLPEPVACPCQQMLWRKCAADCAVRCRARVNSALAWCTGHFPTGHSQDDVKAQCVADAPRQNLHFGLLPRDDDTCQLSGDHAHWPLVCVCGLVRLLREPFSFLDAKVTVMPSPAAPVEAPASTVAVAASASPQQVSPGVPTRWFHHVAGISLLFVTAVLMVCGRIGRYIARTGHACCEAVCLLCYTWPRCVLTHMAAIVYVLCVKGPWWCLGALAEDVRTRAAHLLRLVWLTALVPVVVLPLQLLYLLVWTPSIKLLFRRLAFAACGLLPALLWLETVLAAWQGILTKRCDNKQGCGVTALRRGD